MLEESQVFPSSLQRCCSGADICAKFAVCAHIGVNHVCFADDKIKATGGTIQASEDFADFAAFPKFEKREFRDPTVLVSTFKGSHRGHENRIRVLEFLGRGWRRYTRAGSQFLPGKYYKRKYQNTASKFIQFVPLIFKCASANSQPRWLLKSFWV